MRYVNDLTKVSLTEIDHKRSDTPIQAIIEVKDPANEFQAVVVIWEDGDVSNYSKDGRHYGGLDQVFIFKPVKKEGWINIYSYAEGNAHNCGIVFSDEAEAKRVGKKDECYVATTKVTWEE